MVAHTSSSSLPRRRRNPLAHLSLLCGVLAVAAIPALVAASRYVPRVRLLDAIEAAVPAAVLFGLASILAARGARRRLSLSLGRCGGDRVARTGRALALLGVYVGCSGAVALGFYAVLRAYS